MAFNLRGAWEDFWRYWSSLDRGEWEVVLIVGASCFVICYFMIYPSIRGMDTSGRSGKLKLSLILVLCVFFAIYFGYKNESTFHFKEFVYEPTLQFLHGIRSWYTWGTTLIMLGLGLLIIGFAKRTAHALGWN